MSGVYDVLWVDTLTNSGVAYNLQADTDANDEIYMDLCDGTTAGNYDPDTGTDETRSDVGASGSEAVFGQANPATCDNTAGAFTVTGSGTSSLGEVIWNNTLSPVASFTSVTGNLTYITLYYATAAAPNDADYKLICYFSSGTGFGSDLVSADVDVTFDTGTNKIFRITS